MLPPRTSPTPRPALFPPCRPSSRARALTKRCRRRPRTGVWTGTLCRAWRTGTAPGGPLYGSCVAASWGKDFRENGTVSGSHSAVPASLLPPHGPSRGPRSSGPAAYWCSIWKLRCPLNQSLKADSWTLHVARSWKQRAGGSTARRATWEGPPGLLRPELAERRGWGTVPGPSLLHVAAGLKLQAREAVLPLPLARVCAHPPSVSVAFSPGLPRDGPLPGWRPSPCSGRGQCAWGCGSSV